MNTHRLNIQIEKGWRLVEVRHEPPNFLCSVVIANDQGKTWIAGYDLGKGIFLSDLPITIDASQIRNIIRNAITQ